MASVRIGAMPVRVVRWTEVVPTRTVVAGATRISKTATEEAIWYREEKGMQTINVGS
jgi:hypothetical protein